MTETPMERVLATMWQEVFGRRIRPTDNFLALGGHSLLAIRLMGRIGRQLDRELPVRLLFEAPTVRDLAARLEALHPDCAAARPRCAAPGAATRAPASLVQQRFWRLSRRGADRGGAGVFNALRLKGPLDAAALERSFQEIVRRHAVLRTRIVRDGRELVQEIAEKVAFSLPIEPIEAPALQERLAAAVERARAEAARSFPIDEAPLVRARLLRLDPDDHVLLVQIHRAAADGYAIQILIRELSALYDACVAGQPSPLPPLAVQYADYARWQRTSLQAGLLEQQLRYWQLHLAGVPDLSLPLDRELPSTPAGPAGRLRRPLDPVSSEALRNCAAAEGVTLFTLVLAAFEAALARFARQDRFAVATIVTGRSRPGFGAIIGNFSNTVPLRAEVSEEQTLHHLLLRVQDEWLDAFGNADVPLDEVIDGLRPAREGASPGVARVMFGLNHAPGAVLTLRDVRVTAFSYAAQTETYHVSLWVLDFPEGIQLLWRYRADLFDARTIVRLDNDVVRLLTSVAAGRASSDAGLAQLRAAV